MPSGTMAAGRWAGRPACRACHRHLALFHPRDFSRLFFVCLSLLCLSGYSRCYSLGLRHWPLWRLKKKKKFFVAVVLIFNGKHISVRCLIDLLHHYAQYRT
ncbi:hypothetical protein BD289DRAFT_51517 [Coniella lustricola]|uniref:Uncharacterized protein n=1 Tax=Coniella lustricola TaxID=2025994 RepID=A0A2T3A1A5_9PEZI|nr:hypothetical protein BD289DRAFT_51517 [Coniella lustricola]